MSLGVKRRYRLCAIALGGTNSVFMNIFGGNNVGEMRILVIRSLGVVSV
jgi:hypothetical protein